ncbi:MAG: ABC transporter substrate-binding protein [Dehalococcoidia bacterium]|nr:ABC transporter substrate-binding protein [Dehalococcoidia bacterium]
MRVSRRAALGGLVAAAGLVSLRCAPRGWGSQETPRPVAQPGGVLRVAIAGELTHLDPHAATPTTQLVTGLVYSRLLRPRAGAGVWYDSGELMEDLAEKWEQADDLTHIFYLRRGVRFHEIAPVNGREVVADDVKATLERLQAMRSQAPSLAFAALDRVETPDRYSVKVTLREPMPSFVTAVALPAARVAPAELLERDSELRRLAIGSGPFQLTPPLTRSTRITLRRNPAFFRSGLPYLDAIDVLFTPDRATELAMLRNRETDIGSEPFGLTPSEGESLRAATADVQVIRAQRPSVVLLAFNCARAPFNDVRARQAISLALDRRQIAREAQGESTALASHVPPSLTDWALQPDEVERLFGRRDPARARALWAEAAVGDPGDLVVAVQPAADLPGVPERLADELRDVGFRPRIVRQDSPAAVRAFAERQYDVALIHPPASTEPDDWAVSLYLSASPRNQWGYVDRRFDELARSTRRGADRDGRRRAIIEVQRYLADKMPATPLFSPSAMYAMHTSVKGWAPHWSAGLPAIEEAWLDRPRDDLATPRPR